MYRTHARCQNERLQRGIPVRILGIKGAHTQGRPHHMNPGLRPYIPPVKTIPGGYPHLRQIIIAIIRGCWGLLGH